MSGFASDLVEDFSERTNRYGGETEQFSESYTSDSYGGGRPPQVQWPWRARWHEGERRWYFVHEETGEEVWDYDEVIRRTRGGGERVYETESTTFYDGGGRPPPPEVPWPWRAHWHEGERRWYFVHEETGEQIWDFDEVIRRTRGGGERMYETETTTYESGGYGGRGYGGEERVYESEEVVEEGRRHHGGGHGMAYGAVGAVAGLAAGAGLMYEGEKIHNDWERDKYRVEDDVENFPENAAEWTGDKVGEAEYDVSRFDNRVDQGWDNTVNDVEYAPEEAAGWFGRKVGDVERFDDNVDAAYDQGRYEGRNDW